MFVFPAQKYRGQCKENVVYVPNKEHYIPCMYHQYFEDDCFSDKICLYFHANAEDIFNTNYALELCSGLQINFLVMEYPGYSVYAGSANS